MDSETYNVCRSNYLYRQFFYAKCLLVVDHGNGSLASEELYVGLWSWLKIEQRVGEQGSCCGRAKPSNHTCFDRISWLGGSIPIHRKTMKDLGVLAVLGIRERPNLAHNIVYHRQLDIDKKISLMPSNAFLAEILPFFPVTFLVVTTINMLTFGILGSFQIHRKTMIDLGALAVIGIQERPYLAHNFNSYHREKNHDPAIISRFWPKSCRLWLFLRLFCHFFGCHGHKYACFAHAPAHARCMRKEPAP